MSDQDPARGTTVAGGLALGMCFGVALGLLVFDNLALGIGVGMALGLAVSGAAATPRNRRESTADAPEDRHA